ncbi:membrane protein [Streptomyces phage Vorvolakos]|uniref:Uncharacterized protein n=2 Tax=Flowerpowervirus flowerpower TaxID=2846396 RepID=A0A2U8UNG8_9CAUD|nr:hypothetical protein HWB61_gp34 [Streptomyces phage FlowerPower]AWN05148.1 hypothetical protein SEA_FLOWERPOWER_67 [Streptomyces phage FlowerPower]QEA11269.1 hypothetical protein SEA_GEOSTIN_62 [Streptomyces phage Geostin]QZD97113.1 membrane protein [Streptomyces phage RetrieverFever]UOW93280.1 membrane protein [Streptomyces phage Vorvolakos]
MIGKDDWKDIFGGLLDGLAAGLLFAGGALVGFVLSLPFWY